MDNQQKEYRDLIEKIHKQMKDDRDAFAKEMRPIYIKSVAFVLLALIYIIWVDPVLTKWVLS